MAGRGGRVTGRGEGRQIQAYLEEEVAEPDDELSGMEEVRRPGGFLGFS